MIIKQIVLVIDTDNDSNYYNARVFECF